MKDTIQRILLDASALKASIAKDKKIIEYLEQVAGICKERLRLGGTIYTCGNGGSTCDAMHFVEELVARFKRERAGMRAMHFMDASTMSCWSNDYSFAGVFERQAQTFCGPHDVLFGFSTSGNSENIIRAVSAAKTKGTYTVAFSGKDGGKLRALADTSLVVPSSETERIQEIHITFVHIICELLET